MLNEKKNKEAVEEMKCPYCNQDMEAGFLTSDARCIAWRRERHEPGLVSRNDRHSGVQLARKTLGAAVVENAYCCAACRKIVVDYSL